MGKNEPEQIKAITKLLDRHGFTLATYGSNIGFYKTAAKKNNEVPITCWYFVSAKEFELIVGLLNRIEEAKCKLDNLVEHYRHV